MVSSGLPEVSVCLGGLNTRHGESLPSIRSGLEKQSDISSRNIQRGHADNEANQPDENRAHDMPELEVTRRVSQAQFVPHGT